MESSTTRNKVRKVTLKHEWEQKGESRSALTLTAFRRINWINSQE